MLINLRNALMAGKRLPTASDYVGAISHFWDGIENAGYGTHNPSATTWKDLVGNADMAITQGAFSTDHLVVSNSSAYTSNVTEPPAAIEVVLSRTSGYAVIVSNDTLNRRGLFYNINASEGYGFYFDGNGKASNIIPYSQSNALSVAGMWDSSDSSSTTSTTYINGQINDYSKKHSSSWDSRRPVDVGGNGQGSYRYGFYGKIYRLTFHFRVPTADEIAANYAIDKARFGLPDAT